MNDSNTHSASATVNNKFRMGNLVLSAALLLVQLCGQAQAWGGSGSGSYSIYGNAAQRDWLYDGSTLSLQVLGCVWGIVDDSEEAGCLQDDSEDGTYNWYMMANCRRPQVAYAVYSGGSCSKSNFIGSVSCLSASTRKADGAVTVICVFRKGRQIHILSLQRFGSHNAFFIIVIYCICSLFP